MTPEELIQQEDEEWKKLLSTMDSTPLKTLAALCREPLRPTKIFLTPQQFSDICDLKMKVETAMTKTITVQYTIHELKTWPPYFQEVIDGFKNFEVRKDDREFKVGDALLLREYDEVSGYSGRVTYRSIIYKLTGEQFGIKEGFCVLGLSVLLPKIEGINNG